MSEAKTIEEILGLEKARSDAMVAKDLAVLGPLLAEDLVHIHSSGRVDTKQSLLAGMAEGYGAIRCNYTNVRVRAYGDCAITSGEVVMDVKAKLLGNLTLDLIFTNVWVRDGSGWRNAHWHSVKRA